MVVDKTLHKGFHKVLFKELTGVPQSHGHSGLYEDLIIDRRGQQMEL